jgi:hypothetical protein
MVRSVIGRRRADAATLPEGIPPQLTQLVDAAPDGDQWLHEIKYDGYRMMARLDRGAVKLLTRTGLRLDAQISADRHSCGGARCARPYLGGELCGVGPDGITSFSRIQAAADAGNAAGVVFFLFDLLHLDDEDIAARPLTLKHHIGERVDVAAIREGWDEALRIGISIEDRALAPSTVLKKLAALPKTNVVSRALREIGRIERTLFMIEWYSRPELRDRCRVGLNKGEASNKLARAVFFHERGEIRDGSFESQAFRASGLNLVVSAIVLWNTAYLLRAVESLRAEGQELPDDLIRHISPQIWEHINLTGIYDWRREPQPKDTFRSLRTAKEKFIAAA